MLANNEPVQDINLEQVFSTMLNEIPWASLRVHVQANSQLLKLCTAGGHRVEPKSRKRVQDVILKEARKAEFSQNFCNGLFATWYPVHKDLHKTLEDYFHSDEYKKYREEHELDETDYVLPDDVFEETFRLEELEPWRVLLCFSPLQFNPEQMKRVVSDSEGNVELLRRSREQSDRIKELEKENERLAAEAERLKASQVQAAEAALEHRKAYRALRSAADALEKKLETSLADNKKLHHALAESEAKLKYSKAVAAAGLKKEVSQLSSDLTRVEAQLAEWQSKYEQERVRSRGLSQQLEETEQLLADEQEKLKESAAEIEALNSFPNLLLDKFDWRKVSVALKLTPALQRQFNSLIRRLNYEEDRSLSIEGTLSEFWTSLMAKETELIESIAKSNTSEVISGDVEDYWLELTDAFEDARIGLEARTMLLKMLHEIFYQVLDMESLEAPKILQKKSRTAKKT